LLLFYVVLRFLIYAFVLPLYHTGCVASVTFDSFPVDLLLPFAVDVRFVAVPLFCRCRYVVHWFYWWSAFTLFICLRVVLIWSTILPFIPFCVIHLCLHHCLRYSLLHTAACLLSRFIAVYGRYSCSVHVLLVRSVSPFFSIWCSARIAFAIGAFNFTDSTLPGGAFLLFTLILALFYWWGALVHRFTRSFVYIWHSHCSLYVLRCGPDLLLICSVMSAMHVLPRYLTICSLLRYVWFCSLPFSWFHADFVLRWFGLLFGQWLRLFLLDLFYTGDFTLRDSILHMVFHILNFTFTCLLLYLLSRWANWPLNSFLLLLCSVLTLLEIYVAGGMYPAVGCWIAVLIM